MNARDIIIAPVITEKSVAAMGEKKYTFRVADGSNKIEIAKAVEEIFGVKVAKVNTISMKGAGHLGAERVTVQNLEIVKIDVENNLIAIKGAIPGPRKGIVVISDTVKA